MRHETFNSTAFRVWYGVDILSSEWEIAPAGGARRSRNSLTAQVRAIVAPRGRDATYSLSMGLAGMAASFLFPASETSGFAAEILQPLRVGIIGLDTSHSPALTKLLNESAPTGELAGIRVVAAYAGGSDDMPISRDRLAGFTAEVRALGVEIVESIDALLQRVDAVMLESVDGRPHLEQIKPVLVAKKPVFVDKPVAGSLDDAVQLFALAHAAGVPCFSSSSLRFSPGIAQMRNHPEVGDVLGCDAYGPCPLEPHHPDLFWYGMHGIEALFTIMGTGCQTVSRVQTAGSEMVVGVWEGGRIGTFRGIRDGATDYGAMVFGSRGIRASGSFAGYQPLAVEIAKFFRTGRPPVSAEETLEIYAFMEAADASQRTGGAAVDVRETLEQARRLVQH